MAVLSVPDPTDSSNNPLVAELHAAYGGLSPEAKAVHDQVYGAPAQLPAIPAMAASPVRPSAGSPAMAPMHAGMSAGIGNSAPTASASALPPMTAGHSAPMMGSASPAAASTTQLPPLVAPGASLGKLAMPETTPQDAHTSHLRDLEEEGSGVSQIKSPWARIPLEVADAIGSGLFPKIAMGIPGTSAHHALLVNEAKGAVGSDESEANNAAKLAQEGAQTKNLESLPALHEAQAEGVQAKGELAAKKQNATEEHQKSQTEAVLRQHGFKTDETGQVVPLSYQEMSQEQQSIHDLKASQKEVQDATAALDKAKKDNIPAQMEMAQKRIETAQQNASTAAGRLGLSGAEYNAKYLGTDAGGKNALPGAPADESGHPIGITTAGVTKPTTTTRAKGEQGGVIIEAGKQLKQAIDENKDTFGNLESYWDQAVNGSPIANKKAAKLMAQIESFAALQPALHGFRSSQAMMEFKKMIGGIPKNPEALKAAIDGISGTASIMQNAGHINTVKPGGGAPPAPVDPMVKAYAVAHFGGDVVKAQAAIDDQQKGKK